MDFFRICLAENPSYDIGPHFWKMQSTDGVFRSDATKFSEMLQIEVENFLRQRTTKFSLN